MYFMYFIDEKGDEFQFVPQPDITAYELAQIVAALSPGQMGLPDGSVYRHLEPKNREAPQWAKDMTEGARKLRADARE